jgi:hypothetical protein
MASRQFDAEDAVLYPLYVGGAAVATGVGSIQTLGIDWSNTILDLGIGSLSVATGIMIGALIWVLVTNDNSAVKKAQRGDTKERVIFGATAGFVLATVFAPGLLDMIPGLGSGGPTAVATVAILAIGYALLSWIH